MKKTTRWTILRAVMIFKTTPLSARCEDIYFTSQREKLKKNHPVDEPPGGYDFRNGDA
jgi:hypothetical protein